MPDMTGHNSNELTDAENKALHLAAFREALITERELKALKDRRKAERKQYKANGIILADLDFMLRINDSDAPELISAELRRRNQIAAWMALPLHFQADFEFEREPAVDRAYREGIALGLAGKNAPAAGAGEIEQAMLRGWHEGQRKMGEELQSAMDKRNRAREAAAREQALAENAGDEEDDDEPGQRAADDEDDDDDEEDADTSTVRH